MVGVVDVLRELGPISRSAATSGVEATALIGSNESATFRFTVEAGGDYTLLVRHSGDGLTLEANSPLGSATIDPGPSGPFQVVPLRLDSTTYEVEASSRDGRPVFVDWELLLNTGVGQVSSSGPSAVLPSLAVPVPAATPASPSETTSAASESFAVPSAHSPSEPARDSSWASAGLPVGRHAPDPSFSPDAALTASTPPDAHGKPQDVSPIDSAFIDALMPTITIQPVSGNQIAAIESPWWDRLSSITLNQPATDPVESRPEFEPGPTPSLARLADRPALDDPDSSAGGSRLSLISISPGLLLGAIGVTIASRGRVVRNGKFFGRNFMPLSQHAPQLDLHQVH